MHADRVSAQERPGGSLLLSGTRYGKVRGHVSMEGAGECNTEDVNTIHNTSRRYPGDVTCEHEQRLNVLEFSSRLVCYNICWAVYYSNIFPGTPFPR